ncbi:MAG: Type 1 glutamine amidotransferase-like domain-containing protein [Fimbriimonadaceae bacterium]|nr:Type 1 glutamine amidotransferase-like domain-containing protein [Fimbriimonadaceae bacterium]
MGPLFLAGGGSTSGDVVRSYLDAVGRDSLIVVFGQVREEPARAESSREWLIENGARFVVLLPFERITPVERSTAEALLAKAGGVWIPGGDQNLLMERFGEEWARTHIGGAVRRGAAYYGTSAGAMLAGDWMIGGNGEDPGTAVYRRGLGLTDWLIDSHYAERRRQARLAWTAERLKITTTVGLNEGEWIEIRDGRIVRRETPKSD